MVSLLDHAEHLLGEFRFANRSLEPLLTVWSIGAEKLLKMTTGMIHTEMTGSWPTVHEICGEYGHDSAALDRRCRDLIRQRMPLATHPPVIDAALRAVDGEELIDDLLQMLTRYAKSGRFYNLDHLASSPQFEASPTELWEEVQLKVQRRDPSISAAVGGDQVEFDAGRQTNVWKEPLGSTLVAQPLLPGMGTRGVRCRSPSDVP